MDEKQIALRQIAKGGSIIFVGYALLGAFDFFYKVLVARYLSPEDYGVLSLALIVVGVSMTLSCLGFAQAFRKFIPEYNTKEETGKIKHLLVFGLGLSFVAGSIIASIIYFFTETISAFFGSEQLISVLKIFSFVIPFYTIFYLLLYVFLSFKRPKEKVLIETFGRGALIFVLTFIVLFMGGTLIDVSYVYLFSFVISSVLTFLILETKIFSIFKNKIETIDRGRVLSFSIPLLFVGLLGTVLRRSDSFLIGYFMKEYYVGLYNAAYPLAFILILVLMSFNQLFYSIASELYTKKQFNDLKETYGTVTRWIFLFTFPLFLLFVFFPENFIFLFFGAEYKPAYMALIILSFGTFINAIVGAVGILLQVYEKQNFIFKVQSCVVLLNIAMNILLIPRFGIEGAAFATSFCMALWNIINFLKLRTLLPTDFHLAYYLKYAGSAFISLFIFFMLNQIIPANTYTFLLKSIIYGIIYGFFILVTRALKEEDLDILIAFGKKYGLNFKWAKKIFKRFFV